MMTMKTFQLLKMTQPITNQDENVIESISTIKMNMIPPIRMPDEEDSGEILQVHSCATFMGIPSYFQRRSDCACTQTENSQKHVVGG